MNLKKKNPPPTSLPIPSLRGKKKWFFSILRTIKIFNNVVAEHVLKLKKDSNLLNDYNNASLQGRNTKGYGGVEGRAENTELSRSHREGAGKPSLCMWCSSETWAHVREESTDGAGHMERSTLRHSSCDRASGWGDQSRKRQHTCIWGPYPPGIPQCYVKRDGDVTQSCGMWSLIWLWDQLDSRAGESWDPGLHKGVSIFTFICQDLKEVTPGS